MRVSQQELKLWGKIAIKLAIASTLAAGVAQLLNMEYAFYAAIAPIIIIGETPGLTLEGGFNRIQGTIIGTLIGAIFALIVGQNLVGLLLAVALSIFMANYLKLSSAYRVAGYTTAIVVLNHSQLPFIYAANRFVETAIGIVFGILVDNLIWPTKVAENLRTKIKQLLLDLEELYQLVFQGYIQGEYLKKAITDKKSQCIQGLRLTEGLWKEAKFHRESLWVDETWEFLLRRLWEHILAMENVTENRQKDDKFWQGMELELTNLAQVTQESFNELAITVSSNKSRPQLPDLEDSLIRANRRLKEIQTQATDSYSPAELHRFFSFFYAMEEIANKLQRMRTGI